MKINSIPIKLSTIFRRIVNTSVFKFTFINRCVLLIILLFQDVKLKRVYEMFLKIFVFKKKVLGKILAKTDGQRYPIGADISGCGNKKRSRGVNGKYLVQGVKK